MKRTTGLPELLAPAGSFDALIAAVNAGADAVYFGGSTMNARAFAENIGDDALASAVRYCHLHGARAYVTLNTLLTDRELPGALAYAGRLWEAGVDALIVADVGLMRELRRSLPDFELHASTQASVHSADGADQLSALGVSRVVLARELSLAQIKATTAACRAEVEIFLHGALCVSHSGQCLFSSLVGGRSGNRGQCAQPCRLPYNGKYPLSLRDLCLASAILELIDSGVSSLKIEGRMKSPAYVAGVTAIYRRLLDEGRVASPNEMKHLGKLFSRGGFTDGYFRGNAASPMTGVRSEEDKRESRSVAEFREERRAVEVSAECSVRPGEPVSLTLRQGEKCVCVTGDIPAEAIHAPLSAEDVSARLRKLGGTDFVLLEERCRVECAPGLNLSPAALNALRRNAVQALEGCYLRAPTEIISPTPLRVFPSEPLCSASFRLAEQLDGLGVLRDAVGESYLPLWELPRLRGALPEGVSFPSVVPENEREAVLRMAKDAARQGIRLALIENPGQLALARQAGLLPVGDFRMNITNTASAAFWADAGLADAVLSPELPLPAAVGIGGRIIVSGRIPLMLLERCMTRENFGCGACGHAVFTDRRGYRFPLMREYPHRNILLNSTTTYMGDRRAQLRAAGANRLHLLFTCESPEETRELLGAFLAEKPLNREVRRLPKTY